MNSLEEFILYVGDARPTMHDEMVWDTLTYDQKISVAMLVHGGVEVVESKLEEAEEKGYERGFEEGKTEGESDALESQEMTDKLRDRLRDLIGMDLRELAREVLQPYKANGAAPAEEPTPGPLAEILDAAEPDELYVPPQEAVRWAAFQAGIRVGRDQHWNGRHPAAFRDWLAKPGPGA